MTVAYFLLSALFTLLGLLLGTNIRELVLFFALETCGTFVLGFRCPLSTTATEL